MHDAANSNGAATSASLSVPAGSLSVLAGLALLAAASSGAAAQGWKPLGPEGGSVRSFALDPATPGAVFAGTAGGVFHSADQGRTWQGRGYLAGLEIGAVAVAATYPPTIYAGGVGVVTSRNGFAWTRVPTLAEATVVALAVDPSDSAVVYAGSGFGEPVSRSDDRAVTWTAVSAGLPTFRVEDLEVDPAGTVYVSLPAEGVWRSEDRGASWTPRNDGLGDRPTILDLEIDPRTPTTLYAVDLHRVLRSDDGGASWQRIDDGLDGMSLRSLALDPADPAAVYVGGFSRVYRTLDGGATWTVLAAGLPEVFVETLAVAAGRRILAGTPAGVWTAGVEDASWSAGNDGLLAHAVRAVRVDPTDPAVIYAGTAGGGFFKSADRGASWTASNDGLSDLFVLELAIDPSRPERLYAGTGRLGLFRSTDGGRTWARGNLGGRRFDVHSLIVDPWNPDTVMAGTFGGGFLRSTDGGVEWSEVDDPPPSIVTTLVADPVRRGVFYASSLVSGLWKSSDSGESWEPINEGDNVPGGYTLVIDPSDPRIFHATSLGSLYTSVDGGATWTRGEAFTDSTIFALALDPTRPEILYAGTADAGVFESTDGGATWRDRSPGLLHRRVFSLAVDGTEPKTLYAGTGGSGLHAFPAGGPRLLLRDGRFVVEVSWRDFAGAAGRAEVVRVAAPVTGGPRLRSRDSAVLQFFDPANWEMLVKVLDGRAINERFWVLLAAATDVEVTTTITDTSCGVARTFLNPLGQAHDAVIDTGAFTDCEDPGPPSCLISDTSVCLGPQGRFRLEAQWRDFVGQSGPGRLVTLPSGGPAASTDSGLFYFFAPDNWEMMVKVLDGCALNGHFWVFAAATTDVEYTLTVTDLAAGATRTWVNPLGVAAPALRDTAAFATCGSPGR